MTSGCAPILHTLSWVSMSPNDTSDAAREAQVALLAKMTNAQRGALTMRLSTQAIAMSRRAIRRQHPEWSDFEVKVYWARLHYGPEVGAMIDRWIEKQSSE